MTTPTPTQTTIINLNVGGTIFTTTTATLLETNCNNQPNYFHGLLHQQTTKLLDTQGNYFIDRDPTYFQYMLNTLRDGSVILPQERHVLEVMLKEAQFFSIQPLVDHLEATLQEMDEAFKKSKSDETQYTVVKCFSSQFEDKFRERTDEHQELTNVIETGCVNTGGEKQLLMVFKKALSNGQAALLTSLMNMANR